MIRQGSTVRYRAPNGNSYLVKVQEVRGDRVFCLTPDGSGHNVPIGHVAEVDEQFVFNKGVSSSIKHTTMTAEEMKQQRRALREANKAAVIPDRSHYVRSGDNLDIGDAVATMLRGAVGPEDLYKVGQDHGLGTVAELEKKYGHLNNGMIRMNIGNRIRAKFKKGGKI